MVTQITSGVKVSVDVFYQQEYSNPQQAQYMHAYKVHIENTNPFDIKLMSRHWYIFDSFGQPADKLTLCGPKYREVEGEGVVGMQPVITTDEEYQYVSGANIHSDMGLQFGQFTFLNLMTNQTFVVDIPEFYLVPPFKYN